jgi:hypothetical protein
MELVVFELAGVDIAIRVGENSAAVGLVVLEIAGIASSSLLSSLALSFGFGTDHVAFVF